MSRLSTFFPRQDETQQSPQRLARARQGRSQRPGRAPHPFNMRAPQAPFIHGGMGLVQPQGPPAGFQLPPLPPPPADISGPFGPQPTPLGAPSGFQAPPRLPPTDFGENAFQRAATTGQDLAPGGDVLSAGRGGFGSIFNVPPNAQSLAQALPPQPSQVNLGDPTVGRLQGSVFSTSEGGFGDISTSQRSFLEAQGFGVSANVTLPALPGGAPRLQPQDAAVIGPETRRNLAFSPTALADLETRGAASRERLGLRSISDIFPEDMDSEVSTASRVAAQQRSDSRRARTRRKVTGTTRQRRRLGIPQAERDILRVARARGERMSRPEARIQAKLDRGEALSAADQQKERARQIASLSPQAQAQVMVADITARGVLDVQAGQDTPEAREHAVNLALAGQGVRSDPNAIGGVPPLDQPTFRELKKLVPPDTNRRLSQLAIQGDRDRFLDLAERSGVDRAWAERWFEAHAGPSPSFKGPPRPGDTGRTLARPFDLPGVPLF